VLVSAAVKTQALALWIGVLVGAVGCRPELPDPPDPDRPIATTSCADQPLLGLQSVGPDSSLTTPPWLAACSVCPVGGLDLNVTEPALPRVAAWTEPGRCVAAIPTEPWPAVATATAEASLFLDEASGSTSFDVPVLGGHGPNPEDLLTATFRLPLDRDHLALPSGDLPLGRRTLGQPDLLLELSATADPSLWDARAGLSLPGESEQDLCEPTSDLGAWTVTERQLAAELLDGDVLPVPLGGAVRRAGIQARLSSSGAALQSVGLVAVFDAARRQDETGQAPDAFCAEWETLLGRPFCGPCGDPADGATGLPTCYTLVWEWSLATATSTPLTPVDPADLPLDCPGIAR